jgi:hypothetical protein
MRRTPRLRKPVEVKGPLSRGALSRRLDADIPEVAVVRSEAGSTQGGWPPAPEQDPVEDAVRRMVEAAYT